MTAIIITLLISVAVGLSAALYYSSESTRETAITWAFFNVCVAAVPVLWTAIEVLLAGKGLSVSQLGNGELILIASALLADALGRAIFCKAQKRLLFGSLSGLCVVLLFLATLLFATISKNRAADEAAKTRYGNTSLGIFLATVVLSGACIMTIESSKGARKAAPNPAPKDLTV